MLPEWFETEQVPSKSVQRWEFASHVFLGAAWLGLAVFCGWVMFA